MQAVSIFMQKVLEILRRAKGEILVLLYVSFCLFVVLSTISRQPVGRIKPNFACGRTLIPDVSSPLLGVSAPRRAEKGGNEIFGTIGVNGEFLHFLWFLSDISATRGRIHTKFYLCRDNVCRRAPSPSGVHLPLGAGGRRVKNSKKWGGGLICAVVSYRFCFPQRRQVW